MSQSIQIIKNRMSLRKPQADSLDILAALCDKLTLKKDCNLEEELNKVKALYPICADFERNFPSLCFALATGVGKTRLMGAFITYLYLEKKIRNFFVVAPNLTIYNKLIQDFSELSHPKYVFKGIGEFARNQPLVITGENYQTYGGKGLYEDACRINIFNISKINAETRGGNAPRIKRLSEYLGESYFNYLSSLEDLVLVMDESHHYRADRGMQVLNELKPILGLELTATPQIESGNQPLKFKNVVFEYSLAKAIKDGFVKEPAVATRRNFNPESFRNNKIEEDRLKIEDGIRLHEDTKVALELYAKNNQLSTVKPFVLIVAANTEHSGEIKEMIQSENFFGGYYKDKVLEIHSNQRGEEKEDNIQLLLSLERQDNPIEIVIHVNMLKEGWDVTNLYTIIPLRTATSLTLREQTIGRGLRLPYSRKTGDLKVDTLTIVAHDRFQEIIDAANRPDSIIRQENIIEIDEQQYFVKKEVITSQSRQEAEEKKATDELANIEDPKEKTLKEIEIKAKQKVFESIPQMNRKVKSVEEMKSPEIKQQVIENIKEQVIKKSSENLFIQQEMDAIIAHVNKTYDSVVDQYFQNSINIPRVMVQPSAQVKAWFKDFDLDALKLNYQPVDEEIIKHLLSQNTQEVIQINELYAKDKLENLIIMEITNFPEVDYTENADLLNKLATQALNKFKSYISDIAGIKNIVLHFKKDIAALIYSQMMENFHLEPMDFEKAEVLPFVKIENHNYTKEKTDQLHDLHETITPTSLIPSKVFTGFKKAYHNIYKFDSKTEKDFAIILERDENVEKWLRPASNQFHIYWNRRSSRYEPDFLVETKDCIYLIETKDQSRFSQDEVQEKARAAVYYCDLASQFNKSNAINDTPKKWKYILIPHNYVLANFSFINLAAQFEFKN